MDTLHSKYGDKLTGTISDPQIKITLLTNTDLLIFRDHIKEIEFRVWTDLEQKVFHEKSLESPSPTPISK